MGRKRRSPYEISVAAVAVALALIMSAALYAGRLRVQKNELLIQELSTLRRAVTLYRAVNYALPADLVLLLEEGPAGGEREGRPYLEIPVELSGGKIIDLFGNPYAYDHASGWVSSTTPGCESW